jgi:WD40 repeat-containing protein SMU1
MDNNINNNGAAATEEEQQRPKKRKKKAFDLVLGDVEIDPVNVGEAPAVDAVPWDPIPGKPYTTLKFGKKATAESAIFAPDTDASGTPSATSFSLVTGSSDGLIEIYDAHNKYATLRMDLPYQEKDELMGHDDSSVLALAASNDGSMLATGASDGEVKIWRISTGKCLRRIPAHDGSAISCLCFSPDGTHILTGSQDSNCREFGLRTSRMLKEFHGHSSYVHTCQYVFRKGGHQLNVVTSSADATVRIWDAKTSEVLRVLRPVSLGETLTPIGASIVVDHRSDLTSGAGGCPAIHTVLQLHTPADAMIIVPRGLRAFLVNFQGSVIRTFQDNVSIGGKVFVAATVSPSNHWLYCITEDGICCVFDILTGKIEKSLRNFGEETTSKSKDGSKSSAEISGLVHHPHKGVLAAFSNDKGQKKGQLVLWK